MRNWESSLRFECITWFPEKCWREWEDLISHDWNRLWYKLASVKLWINYTPSEAAELSSAPFVTAALKTATAITNFSVNLTLKLLFQQPQNTFTGEQIAPLISASTLTLQCVLGTVFKMKIWSSALLVLTDTSEILLTEDESGKRTFSDKQENTRRLQWIPSVCLSDILRLLINWWNF